MNEKQPRPYPGIGQSVLILIINVCVGLACFPLLFAERWVGKEVVQLVAYAAVFGITFLIVHLVRRKRTGREGYRLGLISWRIAALIALGSLALLMGVVTPLGELIPLSETTKEMVAEAAGQTGLATMLMFVFLAPLLEELIFRGVMLDGLLQTRRPFTAIAVSSLLFGVAHFNEAQLVTGLVMGGFLGWVYHRTRSVGPCIVGHMAANLSGYVLRFFVDVDEMLAADQSLVGTIGWTATLGTILGGCVVFVVVVVLLRREFERTPLEAVVARDS